MAVMKVRQIIRRLRREGRVLDRQEGSHRQYAHPDRPGLVTVNGGDNDDIGGKLLDWIMKQAGWK